MEPETVAYPANVKDFARTAASLLEADDPILYELVQREYERQKNSLAMVASCSPAHPSVLACEGTFTSNVTAEGYPSARFHAGCEFVDQFEQLAIDRAKEAFRATYANVQPHTASTANQTVYASLLEPNDTLLGLDLDSGGHLSHGARVNISGKFYHAISYGLDEQGRIDYERARDLAVEHRPKLIICGTTAYPRRLDWARFREIADQVGAYLLADITHIAGLVISGHHPSPIDIADVTTTCTHKQLYGPRGGLILMGSLHSPDKRNLLRKKMQQGVFPFMQGAPIVNNIVAKACALGRALEPEFKDLCDRIVCLATRLADDLASQGAHVLSGGTDNHIVVVDVLKSYGVTGICAERALESCGIIVNKNRIPGDTKSVRVTSGIRLGTNSLAARRMSPSDLRTCADLFRRILSAISPENDEGRLPEDAVCRFRQEVESLCSQFPIPGYP